MSDDKKRSGLFGLGAKSSKQSVQNEAKTYLPWYDFSYELDGVYVNFYYTTLFGSPLKAELVRFDIARRGIHNAQTDKLNEVMLEGETRYRIAPPQEERSCPGALYAQATRDEMGVSVQLLPPCALGEKQSFHAALDALKNIFGYTYGIDEKALASVVESKLYFEPTVVAHGLPPVAGQDSVLDYRFQTGPFSSLREGRLPDFDEEHFFDIIHAGDVLVEKIPGNNGQEGITVSGARLMPVGGRDCRLPDGDGVISSPDGLRLLAARDGRAYLKNNRVVVSEVLIIHGDANLEVGDIDFDGDVLIGGGVQNGAVVRATGNIEIAGPVEAAAIDAGRNLVLYQGMQGGDEGVLRAGEDIYARYIIRCGVEAGGNLYGDYVVSCQISVMGVVYMVGEHAKIFGGMLRASSRVWVNSVSTVSGEKTVIEIGTSPKLRRRLLELEEQRSHVKAQLEKIDNLARVPVSRNETAERLEIRKKLLLNRDMLQLSYDEILRETDFVKSEIRKRSDGKLHVRGELAPDVKITIDGISLVVRMRAFLTTFKCRDGVIISASYEGNDEQPF